MAERNWEKDWEMCERATPGKWEIKRVKVCDFGWGKEGFAIVSIGPIEADASADDSCVCVDVWLDINEADAEFIAAAREALPYWLQYVRELEKENDRITRANHKYREMYYKENAKVRELVKEG